jgi:signal transduction histidine kinase
MLRSVKGVEPVPGGVYIHSMRLSRRTVRIIVGLMVLALLGLVALQVSLLMNSSALKEQTFRQNVVAALNAASDRLADIAATDQLFVMAESPPPGMRYHFIQNEADTARGGRDSTMVVSVFASSTGKLTTRMVGNEITYQLEKPQRVTIKSFDALGRLDTTFVDTMKSEGAHDLRIPTGRFDGKVYFIQVKADSAMTTLRWEQGGKTTGFSVESEDVARGKVIERVARAFSDMSHSPVAERVSVPLADSVLSSALEAHAIDLPFEFGVFRLDSLTLGRTTLQAGELLRSEFNVPLSLLEPFRVPERLVVYFPGYRAHMLAQLLPELSASVVLLSIIVFSFAYTVRTLYRQEEFAGRLSDFINTMTHEFKTPISTIALASEAIERPEVASAASRLARYNAIIRDEAARMKTQVEKILQMAALEEGEEEFSLQVLDLHTVIRSVVESVRVQVQARQGTLEVTLKAPSAMIRGDALHLQNVLASLLDNATKYSPERPALRVETAQRGPRLRVEVRDSGIGIAEEHLARVFEKYYRVPTGNLHDVKGFGLGLSYVRLVTEAHGGTVSIRSRPGAGTTVELEFPLLEDPAESSP